MWAKCRLLNCNFLLIT